MNRDHRRSSHPPTVTSSPGVCLREDSPYLQTTTTTFLSTTTTITFTAITKPQSPPRFSQKLFQLSNSSLKPLFYPRTHTRTHAHVSCRRWPILFKSYTRARVPRCWSGVGRQEARLYYCARREWNRRRRRELEGGRERKEMIGAVLSARGAREY